MGDINQLNFIKSIASNLNGPVLEIGSRDYGNTPNFRPILSSDYTGIDMLDGKGVDRIVDLSVDFETIDRVLDGRRFSTIICFSVLEHCLDVYKVAQNIQKLLADGGKLLVSVPFSWEYHGFPNDYWRFTPDTIKFLFSGVEFDDRLMSINTSNIGQVAKVDTEFFKIDLAPKSGLRKKRYSLLTGILIKLLRSFGLMRELLDNIYLLPPVEVNMVGVIKK